MQSYTKTFEKANFIEVLYLVSVLAFWVWISWGIGYAN